MNIGTASGHWMVKVACAVSLIFAGCGLRVPPIQEFPGNASDGQLLTREIVQNITCEVQDAVTFLVKQDEATARLNQGRRSAKWILGYGAQISLNLTFEEKSALNPNATFLNPPSELFALAIGGGVASSATRVEKLGTYHTVKDLLRRKGCGEDARPNKGMLLQSDLGLRDWLVAQALLSITGEVDYPTDTKSVLKSDVFSHEIKFEIVTSGDLTPSWKLVRATINSSGTFLSASRGRTHSLVVTIGPTDEVAEKSTGKPAPGKAAASAHFASEIGIAVANSLKGARAAGQ